MSEQPRRHVRRGEAEWRRLIDEQRASGESQSTFCRQRGLSVSTFQHWKRRLAEEAEQQGEGDADWLALPMDLAAGATTGGGWDIELDLGDGLCLRLRRR